MLPILSARMNALPSEFRLEKSGVQRTGGDAPLGAQRRGDSGGLPDVGGYGHDAEAGVGDVGAGDVSSGQQEGIVYGFCWGNFA